MFFASSRLPFSSSVTLAQARRLSSSPPGLFGVSILPQNAPSITVSARPGTTPPIISSRSPSPTIITLLPLEETRAADKAKKLQVEAITDVAMRLEKAVEKGRLTDSTPPRSWWVPILSTSNSSLDQLAQGSGFRVDDAH